MKYDATIMIPVFNSEKYLPECLESALNQETVHQYEVIVVNDNSVDGTEETLEKLIETLLLGSILFFLIN